MLKIPDSLKRNVRTTYGDAGALWLSVLPSLIEKYLKLWSLRIVSEFEEQSFNYVVKVQSLEEGTLCILKAGPHLKGRLRESVMLKAYASASKVDLEKPAKSHEELPIVRLLRFAEEDGVLLLSAIEPGLTLESQLLEGSISEEVSTYKAALLMKKLFRSSGLRAHQEKITPIQIWGLGYEKFLRENCRGTSFSRPFVEKADEVFKYLHRTSREQMLLHGDLHHGNILIDGHENFLLIDPKGVSGDPGFEVGAFLRNPLLFLGKQPDLDDCLLQRITVFAKVLEIDKQRVWGWAFSQAVLAAIWTVEDRTVDAQKWISVAETFQRLENKI